MSKESKIITQLKREVIKARMNMHWTTLHGETKLLKDIDDTHLANLILWVNKKGPSRFSISFVATLYTMVEQRGLKKSFLKKAPYPYKDPMGYWVVYDHKKDKLKKLSK